MIAWTRYSLWVVLSGALLSCANRSNLVEPAPAWVSQSPVLPGYYIGIGSASKAIHPLDADAIAKANALDNLSREIRVQVQSTSTMNTLQVNDWLSESFQQQSTSSTREDLEGFELVDSYSDEASVMVYYRLNKAEHARIQERKRQAAVEVAMGHLSQAREAADQHAVRKAVDDAVRGLDALRPYMDRPLVHVDESGQETRVAQELLSMVDACVAGLELVANVDELNLKVEDSFRGEVQVSAMFNDHPAANVPLTYSYKRGTLPTRGQSITDNQGTSTVIVEKIEPGNAQATLEVRVDPKAFFDGLPLMHPMREAAKSLQAPPLRITCNLVPIRLHLQVEERAFGKSRDRQVLLPALQESLQQANVLLVSEGELRADDLILVLQADARPGGSGQGFHTMYVDLVGTVKTPNGEVRFTQTETNIKGIQGDPKRATDVAYSKAAEEIQEDFVPDLIQLWHGF